MKNLYVLQTIIKNGTTTIGTHSDIFLDKELAEKSMNKLKEINKNSEFNIIYDIQESVLIEDERDLSFKF